MILQDWFGLGHYKKMSTMPNFTRVGATKMVQWWRCFLLSLMPWVLSPGPTRRKEHWLTPGNCPLASTCAHIHASSHTHNKSANVTNYYFRSRRGSLAVMNTCSSYKGLEFDSQASRLGGSQSPTTPVLKNQIPLLALGGTCTHIHLPTHRHTS